MFGNFNPINEAVASAQSPLFEEAVSRLDRIIMQLANLNGQHRVHIERLISGAMPSAGLNAPPPPAPDLSNNPANSVLRDRIAQIEELVDRLNIQTDFYKEL